MFTLTVLPDGHLLLTTEQQLTERAMHTIREAFDKWRETPEGVAVIQECRVQHATSVEIDLERVA